MNTPETPQGGDSASSARVRELPLFPLDLVLFPNMPVPLHIFEDRYKEMVNRCVRESLPFGIVRLTGVDVSTGRAQTSRIGCTARIVQVERLPDGCMNIEVVGEGRFRILDTHEQLPYRVGLTETVEDEAVPSADDVALAADVQRLLRDFLICSLTRSGHRIPEFELPDEPQPLSYLAAWVLPVEMEQKQELLDEDSAGARLTVERDVLQKEVARLRREAQAQRVVVKVAMDAFASYACAN